MARVTGPDDFAVDAVYAFEYVAQATMHPPEDHFFVVAWYDAGW